MGGLRRIAKLYGGMKVIDRDGSSVRYVWDYVADDLVTEAEMPVGSERHKASEKAKWSAAIADSGLPKKS